MINQPTALTGSSPPGIGAPGFEPVASVPTDPASDPFVGYNRQILDLFAAMDPVDTDEQAAPLMARWRAIDDTAMSTCATTLAGAIGSLEYARREHVQFTMSGDEQRDDKGSRLVLHLIDGALGVMRKMAAEKVASVTPASQADYANTEFEPWDADLGWVPKNYGDHDADLGFPIRAAWALNLLPRSEMIDSLRPTMNDETSLAESLFKVIDAGLEFATFQRNILEVAHLRIMVVGCALLEEQERKARAA